MRCRWWTVPALLLAVVPGLGSCQGARAGASTAAATVQPERLVRLRIGDGATSEPMRHPAADGATLELAFPERFAGHRIALRIDRAGATQTEAPWLELAPKVRADASLPIAGLPKGSYRLSARLTTDGGTAEALGAAEVTAPGAVPVTMYLRTAGALAAPMR